MPIEGSPLDAPAPPLDGLLRTGPEAAPDEVAPVSAQRSMTWHQLQDEADRL
jgi:hypothetical protein